MKREICNIDALIVFPPFFETVFSLGPYPAPHFLVNYLRSVGFRAVQLDLNSELLRLFVQFGAVAPLRRAYASRVRGLERRPRLTRRQATVYRNLAITAAALKQEGAVLKELRREGNPNNLTWRGLPYHALLKRTWQEYRPDRGDAIDSVPPIDRLRDALVSKEAARFTSLVAQTVCKWITETTPAVVGLSTIVFDQFIPSLLVAKIVKEIDCGIHVTMGGSSVTYLPRHYADAVRELGYVDSLIRYEGEEALAELVRRVRTRRPGREIVNVAEGLHSEPRIACTAGTRTLAYLTGSHTRVPADSYCADRPVPVVHSVGCYWGKCAFCTQTARGCTFQYRWRPATAVVNDIQYYAERGRRHVSLIAEAILPQHMTDIAREIIRRKLRIGWTSFLRVDRSFRPHDLHLLKESGFINGTIGLESANDRILKLINKGYLQADVRHFLNACRTAGFVLGYADIILDVPTTTFDEAVETFRFCQEYADVMPLPNVGEFFLVSNSDMGQRPEHYGIVVAEEVRQRYANGVCIDIPFTDPRGMTAEEKEEVLEMYRQHCARFLYKGNQQELQRIRRASSFDEVRDVRIHFAGRYEFTVAQMWFSERGYRYRRGVRRVIIPEYRTENSIPNQFAPRRAVEVSEGFERCFALVSGKTMSMEEVARVLEKVFVLPGTPEDTALDFVRLAEASQFGLVGS